MLTQSCLTMFLPNTSKTRRGSKQTNTNNVTIIAPNITAITPDQVLSSPQHLALFQHLSPPARLTTSHLNNLVIISMTLPPTMNRTTTTTTTTPTATTWTKNKLPFQTLISWTILPKHHRHNHSRNHLRLHQLKSLLGISKQQLRYISNFIKTIVVEIPNK